MLRSQLKKRIWLLSSRLLAIAILLTVAGCASTSTMKPVPEELISQVGIEGIPEARFWADEWPEFSLEIFETYTDTEIRNSFIGSDYQNIDRSMLPIGLRSIDSLIRTQGIGDLYQIYALCERDGNNFNLAYIPAEFTEKPKEGFDPVYMGKLYELGYQMARKGYPWIKAPPGFIRTD